MSGLRKSYVSDVHVLDIHVNAPDVNAPELRLHEVHYPGRSCKSSKKDSYNVLLSNDVWMSNSGAVSIGHKILGSKCIGQRSPLIGDNSVLDYRGNFIGRTFEAGGRTYLDRRC